MVVWIIRLPLSRLVEFASRRVVGRSDGERQQGEIRAHQADNQPDNLEIGPHDAPSLLCGGDHAQERIFLRCPGT